MGDGAMSEKEKTTEDKPTFWDLINRHFPEPYRTIYSDPLTICKTLQAGSRLEMKESCLGVNPPGSESYWDRCAAHQIVSDLQKQHPEWRNADYVKHLRSVKVNGRYLPFGDRALKTWVSEIVKGKKGRPRKKTF